MKAIVCEGLGDARSPLGTGCLALKELPEPKLPDGHVRVQVAAASLNFPDALQIKVGGQGCKGGPSMTVAAAQTQQAAFLDYVM